MSVMVSVMGTWHRAVIVGIAQMNEIPGALGRVIVTRTLASTMNGDDFTSCIAELVRVSALEASMDDSRVWPSWKTDTRPPISAMLNWLANCPAKGDYHALLHGRGPSSHTRTPALARFVAYLSWNLRQRPDMYGIELHILFYDIKTFFYSADVTQVLGGSSVVPESFCDRFSRFLSAVCGGLQAACGSSKPVQVLVRPPYYLIAIVCVCVCVCVCV
jgi:hypothetical protein